MISAAQRMDKIIEELNSQGVIVKLYMSMRVCYMGFVKSEVDQPANKFLFSQLTLKTHNLDQILDDLVQRYEKEDTNFVLR